MEREVFFWPKQVLACEHRGWAGTSVVGLPGGVRIPQKWSKKPLPAVGDSKFERGDVIPDFPPTHMHLWGGQK